MLRCTSVSQPVPYIHHVGLSGICLGCAGYWPSAWKRPKWHPLPYLLNLIRAPWTLVKSSALYSGVGCHLGCYRVVCFAALPCLWPCASYYDAVSMRPSHRAAYCPLCSGLLSYCVAENFIVVMNPWHSGIWLPWLTLTQTQARAHTHKHSAAPVRSLFHSLSLSLY